MTTDSVLQKIFSECGLISLLLSIAIVWLAVQLNNERKGRELDRKVSLETIERYSKAYELVITSNAKLEGILSRHKQ